MTDGLSFVKERAETGDVREPVRVPSCHGGCRGSTLVLYSYGDPPVSVPCVSLGGIGNTPARLIAGKAVTSFGAMGSYHPCEQGKAVALNTSTLAIASYQLEELQGANSGVTVKCRIAPHHLRLKGISYLC